MMRAQQGVTLITVMTILLVCTLLAASAWQDLMVTQITQTQLQENQYQVVMAQAVIEQCRKHLVPSLLQPHAAWLNDPDHRHLPPTWQQADSWQRLQPWPQPSAITQLSAAYDATAIVRAAGVHQWQAACLIEKAWADDQQSPYLILTLRLYSSPGDNDTVPSSPEIWMQRLLLPDLHTLTTAVEASASSTPVSIPIPYQSLGRAIHQPPIITMIEAPS